MIRLVRWGKRIYAYRCAPAHREILPPSARPGHALDVYVQRLHVCKRCFLGIKAARLDEDLRVLAGLEVESDPLLLGDGGVGDGDPDPETQQCFTNDGRNATRFIPGFPASCPLLV